MTVKSRFWPWLSRKVLKTFQVAPSSLGGIHRGDAGLEDEFEARWAHDGLKSPQQTPPHMGGGAVGGRQKDGERKREREGQGKRERESESKRWRERVSKRGIEVPLFGTDRGVDGREAELEARGVRDALKFPYKTVKSRFWP